MEEPRNISDKHMISVSLTFTYPSMRDNLVNPGLDLTSPVFNKRKILMQKPYKTTDISKKLHNW